MMWRAMSGRPYTQAVAGAEWWLPVDGASWKQPEGPGTTYEWRQAGPNNHALVQHNSSRFVTDSTLSIPQNVLKLSRKRNECKAREQEAVASVYGHSGTR
jgi:hypothetical protein